MSTCTGAHVALHTAACTNACMAPCTAVCIVYARKHLHDQGAHRVLHTNTCTGARLAACTSTCTAVCTSMPSEALHEHMHRWLPQAHTQLCTLMHAAKMHAWLHAQAPARLLASHLHPRTCMSTCTGAHMAFACCCMHQCMHGSVHKHSCVHHVCTQRSAQMLASLCSQSHALVQEGLHALPPCSSPKQLSPLQASNAPVVHATFQAWCKKGSHSARKRRSSPRSWCCNER